jgi:hypothetical protein
MKRALRNPAWEGRAKHRGRMLLMRTNEKSDRTVEITDPDLACAGVEVEGAPLINLQKFVRATYDFDADLERAGKNLAILMKQAARRVGKPGDIDSLDAIC